VNSKEAKFNNSVETGLRPVLTCNMPDNSNGY